MSTFRGLRRIPNRGVIAGVLAGIADYLDWNVRALRVAAIVIFVFSGVFPIVFVYALLWYVMEPEGGRPSVRAAESTYESGASTSTRTTTMSDLKSRFSGLEQRLGYMEDCVTTKEFELRQELNKLEGTA